MRQALIQQIGFQDLLSPEPPFDPQLIEEVDKGDYIRQKILLRTGPALLMPVYLLIPKVGDRPLPTVIAYHGHGYGEMYNLAGLIAPRPMLVESADRDPIFPHFAVEKSVVKARQVYQVFQASDQLETDYFPCGHQISVARAYDFLKEKLRH